MANLLAKCQSPFFQMECDIYYATESQDEYGSVNKRWTYDYSPRCSFYTMADESNNKNFTFDDKKFYRMETMLFGRVQQDIRKDSSGLFHPMSHMLITNIRGGNCNKDLFFYETDGDYVGQPTIFEVKMIQPYIGPFASIEYFKVQLERSDTQELNQIVAC